MAAELVPLHFFALELFKPIHKAHPYVQRDSFAERTVHPGQHLIANDPVAQPRRADGGRTRDFRFQGLVFKRLDPGGIVVPLPMRKIV